MANVERDKEIVRLYTEQLWTQQRIADHFGISQSAVSQSIQRMRAAHGPVDKAESIAQGTDILDHMASMAMEIANLTPPPITAGKDGAVVRDPETGKVARDYSGRLAAIREIRALLERKSRLLGLDSATKVETTGTVSYRFDGWDDPTKSNDDPQG